MLLQPRKYTEIANLLIVSYYIYHGQIISESETSNVSERLLSITLLDKRAYD